MVSESIVLMSEQTYEYLKNIAMENASKSEDPIEYLEKFFDVEIAIDNDVPLGLSEVWDKETYEEYLKGKGDNNVG